jgi:hypothetical protein
VFTESGPPETAPPTTLRVPPKFTFNGPPTFTTPLVSTVPTTLTVALPLMLPGMTSV